MKHIYNNLELFSEDAFIFKNKEIENEPKKSIEYDDFIEKFSQKKTTDDCYTPDDVYKIILDFVSENFEINSYKIVRPFFPGGDYENFNYDENSFVLDNPPFSIVSKIARFYIKRGIKFFIFAPHMTLFSADIDCTALVCGSSITYKNGAIVKTSFLTNTLGNKRVIAAPGIFKKLLSINKPKADLPKYKYPTNLLTVSDVQKFVEKDINFCVEKTHTKHCRRLDQQKEFNKSIFGSGLFLSDKAAADKAAADKAAADKAAADKANITTWHLSESEREIIKKLGSQPQQ